MALSAFRTDPDMPRQTVRQRHACPVTHEKKPAASSGLETLEKLEQSEVVTDAEREAGRILAVHTGTHGR